MKTTKKEKTMKTTDKNVFLYGHYDSRGGTIAVEAETREEADAMYTEHYGCNAFDDFMCRATLKGVPDSFSGEGDLESNDEWVLIDVKGFHDAMPINHVPNLLVVKCPPPKSESEPWVDFQEDEDEGSQQVPGYPGWYHPRWDDDAFSFILLRKDGMD